MTIRDYDNVHGGNPSGVVDSCLSEFEKDWRLVTVYCEYIVVIWLQNDNPVTTSRMHMMTDKTQFSLKISTEHYTTYR